MKTENEKDLTQEQKERYLNELKRKYGDTIRLREIMICEIPTKV